MKEFASVHRYTGYIYNLKENWAYKGTTRIPGRKEKNKESPIEFPKFFVDKHRNNN